VIAPIFFGSISALFSKYPRSRSGAAGACGIALCMEPRAESAIDSATGAGRVFFMRFAHHFFAWI
jgi:hypothetical protein